jgi:hypothetical protein
MAVAEALRALLDQWDDVRRHLDQDTLEQLTEILDRLRGATDDKGRQVAAREALRLLTVRLPAGHSVLMALVAEDENRFQSSNLSTLDQVLTDFSARWGDDPNATDENLAWLVAAPALSPEEVRSPGLESDDPYLIRLPRPGGWVQLPAFQFGSDGAPLPLVLRINRLLGADEDPWGVADWWLGRNAWLDDVPAGLLGIIEDDRLLAAAQAELPEP